MINEKYSITDKLEFRISACDVRGSFPSLLTMKSREKGSPLIVSVHGN